MKYIIITVLSVIAIAVIVPLSVSKYREYKCETIIKETSEKMNVAKASITIMRNIIKANEGIMVQSEIVSMNNIIDEQSEKITETEEKFKKCKAKSDVQAIRYKLEPGLDEHAGSYLTPIQEFENEIVHLKAVESFCANRKEIRDRVVKNEMKLKTILKKPISASGLELPDDLTKVGKYAAGMLSGIPKDTPEVREKIKSIGESSLNNQMGVKLYDHIRVLDRIKKVAKSEQVKNRAESFWSSAKASYSSVKQANDAIHWYDPTKDDGTYDSSTYGSLLGNQTTALNFFNGGEQFLTQLNLYQTEVETQYVKYVSSNSYEDVSYSHSKTVDEPAVRYDKEGKAHHYTKSRTVYFSTDGRKFYYTVTTLTMTSRNDQRIYVGEKDSYSIQHSFGNWRSWDYQPSQREGYLCEYKPYGLDNASRVEGGMYNPAINTLCQPVQ